MKEFNELLFETIDDTIKAVFGESASMLIYGFMESHVSLKREEVGEKIEIFYGFLEKLLGSEGARILQNTGLKCLCLKLQREYEEVEKHFSLLDELYEVKFRLLAASWKEERLACN